MSRDELRAEHPTGFAGEFKITRLIEKIIPFKFTEDCSSGSIESFSEHTYIRGVCAERNGDRSGTFEILGVNGLGVEFSSPVAFLMDVNPVAREVEMRHASEQARQLLTKLNESAYMHRLEENERAENICGELIGFVRSVLDIAGPMFDFEPRPFGMMLPRGSKFPVRVHGRKSPLTLFFKIIESETVKP